MVSYYNMPSKSHPQLETISMDSIRHKNEVGMVKLDMKCGATHKDHDYRKLFYSFPPRIIHVDSCITYQEKWQEVVYGINVI